MSINWQDIITTFIATVGGGGVLLAAAAWLIRVLGSNGTENTVKRSCGAGRD
jgi:hypothetical protein